MEFRARAPGKIILSGEHAVVHGSTALAASIDLYTTVSVSSLERAEHGDDLLEVHIRNLELVFSWSMQRIRESLIDLPVRVPSVFPIFSPEVVSLVSHLVEEQRLPEAKIGLSAGVSAFLCLYLSIKGFQSAKVIISSDLPLASGLGSSAAYCVSLAAAMLASSGALNLGCNHHMWLIPDGRDLELVNKWAFEAEKVIHGLPSGIDNTISTYGNMITFQLGKLAHVKPANPLKMLVTNTKVGRNTKVLVAGVAERVSRYQDAMSSIFSAIEHITKELSTVIQSPALDDLSKADKDVKIQELMGMNQGLLQCMGVSHASIENVVRITLKYKLVSKLTGAGGGGCVLTFLPNVLADAIVEKVISELEDSGYQCFVVAAGGRGLEICFGSQ